MHPLGFNEQGLVMTTEEEKHGILVQQRAEFLEGSSNVTCGTLVESWQKTTHVCALCVQTL